MAATALMWLSLLTAMRLEAWQSDVTLWRAATIQAPTSVRAWINRRAAAIGTGDFDDADAACAVLVTLPTDRPFEQRLITQACGPF